MGTGKMVLSLIGIILIIIAAYWVTYWLASKSTRRFTRGRTIKMLDSFSVSKDSGFYIIEVTGKIYLVAMTSGGASLIDTLDHDAVLSDLPPEPQPLSFDKFKESFKAQKSSPPFSDFMKKRGGKGDEPWDNNQDEEGGK